MTDRLQMNLVFNVTAFRVFRAKKFSARGQVIKKRAHLDLSSWRFAAVAHDINLTAIDDDLSSCDCAGLSRGQTKSRHTSNTWQCFAAKSQRRHRLQIGSRPNLARSMSLERQQCVITINTAAIIDHSDERDSSATNHDVDSAGAGVDAVFN